MTPQINLNVLEEVNLSLNKDAIKKELRSIGRDVTRRTKALIQKNDAVSQPGESPFGKTGLLARSLKVKFKQKGMSVQITDTARYALSLESGSNGPGERTQAARPYLSKVLKEMEPEIKRRLERAINLGLTTERKK